jgi:outer membrane protein
LAFLLCEPFWLELLKEMNLMNPKSSVRLSVMSLAAAVGMNAALVSPAHAADDFKIAVVDMQKALQSVDAGKKAKAQLEKEVEAKKKEFDSEKAAITKMGEEFKKQSLAMSDEARAKKQNDLQERIAKLQQKGMETEQSLRMKEQQLTQPIINKLRGVVTEQAKKKGYSMVLEKNENTVIFSQDKDDMTQDVINAYNKSSG